jgi:hypothetical protein
MTKQSSIEARLAQRARLEAVARWNELQIMLARRRRGDSRDVERFSKNAMACRLRQR